MKKGDKESECIMLKLRTDPGAELDFRIAEEVFGEAFGIDPMTFKETIRFRNRSNLYHAGYVAQCATEVALQGLPKPIVPHFTDGSALEGLIDEMYLRFMLKLVRRSRTSRYLRKWAVLSGRREVAQHDDPRKACLNALSKLEDERKL